ncbi:degenerin mec-10-like isoform X2 [Symsagittifera roscoffensis]|uniref:degenerin mec-10-like isoform X2 n=1 Tax=Symsagittifera roscoffensis TaxID=84072 RepID=UPI00307C43D5
MEYTIIQQPTVASKSLQKHPASGGERKSPEPVTEQVLENAGLPQHRMFQLVKELAEYATPQILQLPSVLGFLWVLVYIGFFSLTCSQMVLLIQNYFTYPTAISIRVVFSPYLDFPAVTVCNESPLRKTRVLQDRRYEDLALLDDYIASKVLLSSSNGSDSKCKSKNDYKCPFSGICIPEKWICNDVVNCDDESDEKNPDFDCAKIKLDRDANLTTAQGHCNWPSSMCPEQTCATACDGVPECVESNHYDESDYLGCDVKRSERSADQVPSQKSFLNKSSEHRSFYRQKRDGYSNYYETFDPLDYFSFYFKSNNNRAALRNALAFDQTLMRSYGFHAKDFLIQCSFNHQTCDYSDFKTFQHTHFGNCFTFNSALSENNSSSFRNLTSSKTGEPYGFKLTVFLDVNEYIGLTAPLTGVRVVTHHPKLSPNIYSQGSVVEAGKALLMGLERNELAKMGGKYGNCSYTWPDFLNLNQNLKGSLQLYDLSDCQFYCRQNALALRCGCIDSYTQDFSDDENINEASRHYCDSFNDTQRLCRQSIEDDSETGVLNCPCPDACYTVNYWTQESLASWPSDVYSPFLVEQLLKSKSPQVHNFIREVLSRSNISNEDLSRELRRNFARIMVYYERNSFEKVWESPAYSVTGLLSDIGGNMGLWTGWSVMVFFELLQFFFKLVQLCC